MLFKSIAAAALLASSAAAHSYMFPREDGNTTRICGTPEPTVAQMAASEAMLARERELRAKGEFRALASFSVNTYFHVVASSTSASAGYLTVSELLRQSPNYSHQYITVLHAIWFIELYICLYGEYICI